MADTSVPAISWGPRGPVAPSEADILTGVRADLNAAFGGNLNPSLETPQGQLATSTTAIIGEKNDEILAYVAGVDPAYSTGRMQDGIGRIYFLERNPALPTSVVARCYGLAGVVIPVGALARATDGNNYLCVAGGTIGVIGYVDLAFACVVTGPIACPAGSLNIIYQAIPGWDSINNLADGAIGRVVESPTDFEARRKASVALNAVNSLISVRARVLDVPDVLDAYVIDNSTAAPVTITGVTLAAYALFVAVSGGDPQAVAEAMWSKKPPGVPYYAGNTTRTVEDTSPGYTPPYPSYTVVFETAANLPFFFAVTLAAGADVPSDALAQVQAAIVAAFTGADGGSRARIGGVLYASRFYAAVAAIGPWVRIVSILLGSTTPTLNDEAVPIDQAPTIDAADISLTLV